ncbi:hypothetical protein SVIOM342S_05514 [Streptomyces violaceorubidus]
MGLAVLDAPLPAGADPELSAAALAALLYRCTGQERMALAGPDGELRFRITDGATLPRSCTSERRSAAATDDFLVLGGDSIRAIQVVTRARARGVEVTAPRC